MMGYDEREKNRRARIARPVQLLLIVFLLLGTVVVVSAQEETDEIDLGDPVVLSQTRGPEGVTTVVEIPVAKDTYVVSEKPNTNFGTAPSIRLGHNAGGDGALRPVIQFSLSSIPANATINAASMRIYLFAATGGTTPMGFEARHLVNSWSEGLITWNSHQPGWGDVSIAGQATAEPLGWKELPVTSLVREWYNGSQPNNGVIVIGDERPELERQRWYYSKEAGNSLYPRLVVDYTVAPPDNTPPTSSVESLNTWSPDSFTVRWDGKDNSGGSGIAYFDIQYRANYGSWNDWEMHKTQKSATFEGGRHNVYYEFRSRAVDNAGNRESWPSSPDAGTRVDAVAPTTSMSPLPEYTTTSSFTVNWQGSDAQSGIAHYDLQGRINGGSWLTILENTAQISHRVTGFANGDLLEFRVRAVDNVNNVQPFPAEDQASTTVLLEPRATVLPFEPPILKPTDPITDSFNVSWVGFTAPGTNIIQYELRYRFIEAGIGTTTPWMGVPLPSPTAQSVVFEGPFPSDGIYEFEVRARNTLNQQEPFTGTGEAMKIVDLREPFIEPRAWLPVIGK